MKVLLYGNTGSRAARVPYGRGAAQLISRGEHLPALLAALPLQGAAAPFTVRLGVERIVLDTPPGFSDTTELASPRLQARRGELGGVAEARRRIEHDALDAKPHGERRGGALQRQGGEEGRQMLTTGYQLSGPSAVRYPRGAGPGVAVQKDFHSIPVGKAELRRQGKRIAILAFGSMLKPALEAAEKLDATVANMRFVKPIDSDMVKRLAETHELLVTVEEHQIMGGAGSAVLEVLSQTSTKALLLGLPDRFIDHGDSAKLLSSVGLDAEGIVKSIRTAITE